MASPSFRRSHFCSQLFHILSQLSSASTTSTQPFNNIPDNGSGRMEQKDQERGPECSDPVPQKEVHETIEGVGDKGKDLSANNMVEKRQTSTRANYLNKEKRSMDELELVLKGTDLKERKITGHYGMKETSTKDHGKSSPLKMVDASRERKHGPGSLVKKDEKIVDASKKRKCGSSSQEKKDETKKNYGKQRAETNKEQGVKRLKLEPVQKPKNANYCRHFLQGRCHEGDKCKFSHDTVPKTKSKPCTFFARGICLKGDACPYDHHLSKYPCYNFVSSGSCGRGDACMFSHQVSTNQITPTPSNVSKPELKSPLLSGNTNFRMPLTNHGCSSVQQNHFTNSKGIHLQINTEQKVVNTLQKQLIPAPKGIRFLKVAKLSPSPSSTLKQGMVTPNKESLVTNGTRADQSASGTTQNKVEIPKKSIPKGIKFLSFGKGPVCSFRSPVSSNVNRENSVNSSQLINFVLPKKASTSMNRDDSNVKRHMN